MKRALSISISVALVCGALASYGPTSALASAPTGILTQTEYTDFSNWLAEYTKAFSGKTPNWKDAAAACKDLRSSTPLERAEHRSCVNDLRVYIDLVLSDVLQETCDKLAKTQTTTTSTGTTTTGTGTTTTGTTTTGTTTTGTGTTTTGTTTTGTVAGITSMQLKVYVCMKPIFQVLSRDTARMWSQDVVTRRDGVHRGLTGACLNTLVATSKQLIDEHTMARDAKSLAAGVAQLAQVQAGTLAGTAVNGYAVNTAEYGFDNAFDQLLKDSTPDKLSTCPHEQRP